MDFVRPELLARLQAWRGVLIGLAAIALGLWAGLASTGILNILGWILLLVGAAQSVLAFRRKRFHQEADGPGIVSVDEGEIAYFGPLSGGVVAIRDLQSVSLDPTGVPLHWVLLPGEGAPVHIPVTAAGTDALFDAFSQLDGFPTARMLKVLDDPGAAAQTLWIRARARRIR